MCLFPAGSPLSFWQDGTTEAVCSAEIQVTAAAFAGLCLLATISNWLAQAVGERIAEYDMVHIADVEPRPAPTSTDPDAACCPPFLQPADEHTNEDPVPLQMQ